MPIFNLNDLERRIKRTNMHKDLTDVSPLFTNEEKLMLHEVYSELLMIYEQKLETEKTATAHATSLQVFDYSLL